MIPGFLEKVQSGQPMVFSAENYNAFVDAAAAIKNGAGRQGGLDGGSVVEIKIRNDSGADRDRFDVLGLDVPIIDPTDNLEQFKQYPNFKGVTPAAAHVGKFAILLEPIRAGGIGRGLIAGVTPTKLNVVASGDTHADADAGAYKLKSGTSGLATILWKESGTGDKWAVVVVGSGSSGSGDGAVVRVTSTTENGAGYLPGFLQAYDTGTNTFSDNGAIWVKNLNP